jgi:predicted lysophospholipase L1 biosynthesis ABC-type transport system permease subunit
MRHILFYLNYAFRNLRRSGRWTIFGIFCIAAGVATVVALRSLGLAIADSLVDNVRTSNHGDITLSRTGNTGFFTPAFVQPGDNSDDDVFSDRDLERIDAWVAENGVASTAYISYSNMQLTPVDAVTVGRPQFVSAFLVDPQTFPPTGDILALDPAGVPLRELLTSGNDVVISQNLAESQAIRVGDTVRVSGTETVFTVRGIVPTETEANLRNLFASFFGFAYLHIDHAEEIQLNPRPNTVSLTLPPGTDSEEAATALRREVRASYTTVAQLLRQNSTIGDTLGRFIVVMGLGALLIGGVGIINTMLVMVGRRTDEIAALKTFGLKGRQVAAIFLAEAFLLGLAGSLVGSLFGVLLSGAVNQYGEAFLQQRLVWRLYPEALAYGLGLGLIVTMVFGLIPVLTAVRIRPAIILRPNEPHIAGVGCLQSLFGILLVVLVIGGVAGQILGSILWGIIGVAVTLLILGLLIGIFWVIVWVVSRLPAFGWVDLRLALRNLTSRRLRTATTLLALSAGMFALSSITFVGAGTREILQFQLSQSLGGNVLVFPYTSLLNEQLGQGLFQAQLRNIDGIDRAIAVQIYTLDLVAVNGQPPEITLPMGMDEEMLPDRARREINDVELSVNVQDTNVPNVQTLAAGRALNADDRGQRRIVYAPGPNREINGITVGSTLTLRIDRDNVDFEVVGILESGEAMSFNNNASLVPPDTLGSEDPAVTLNVLQVSDENLNRVLLDLSALVPPVFALDITFIDGLLKRLIDQFSAIPILVGLLSLLAAAVIMANTVALATLERRRQIGILKAVGLKGRRVLLVMLLENTIVGLLGGLLGIGLSALGVAIMTAFGVGDAIPIPRDATLTAIALVLASVVIAWVATFASAQVAIRERVTNILRYE